MAITRMYGVSSTLCQVSMRLLVLREPLGNVLIFLMTELGDNSG